MEAKFENRLGRTGATLALAVVYFVVARASLLLALPPTSASPVWPTTGVGFAAILLLGPWAWRGVALGTLLTHMSMALGHGVSLPVTLWSSAVIAMGNAAEISLGGYLVRRYAGGVDVFDRAERVVKFIVFACLLSTAVSASIGSLTLTTSGLVPWRLAGRVWTTWWLGDSVGALVATPFIVEWVRLSKPVLDLKKLAEIALGLAALGVVARLAFFDDYPVTYLLAPFVLWSAFRFGQRGASTVTLLIAAAATWWTIVQRGPFVRGSLNESLLFLQVFVGVIAVMSMMVAAVLTERREAGAELATSNRILTEQIAVARDARLAEERGREAAAELAADNARLYTAESEARWRAEAAATEADRANRAKSEFLALMSHELRTPLNAILGYTDLLASEVVGPVTERQSVQLERVRASAQHLISLIEGVLTIARGDSLREELRIESIDSREIARESVALVEPAATTKGLRIVLSLPDEPHVIQTDATKARQILINLLSNAVKFTERGTIAVSLVREGHTQVFEVSDTGIGIAEAYHEWIFEPFWQVDQSTTRRVGGTGLGLGVARKLARLLSGDVILTSELGQGSTFRVLLPIGTPESAAAPAYT